MAIDPDKKKIDDLQKEAAELRGKRTNVLRDVAAEEGRKTITPLDVARCRAKHGQERTRRALVLVMGGECPGIAIENVNECCLEANRE